MKKEMQKKLSFVLFVMAVFFAGVALTMLDEAVYVWIAGGLLLATAVFYVFQKEEKESTPTGKATEILLADRMAELMRGNEKAEKGVYIAVKKQHEAMEKGMEELLQKIGELTDALESSVKTLVLYNKENAKQLALSEREELGRLREEIRQLQRGGGASESVSGMVDAVREMSHRLYEEIHENSEAILAELGTTVDCLEEMKEIVNRMNEEGAVRVAGNFAAVPEEEEPKELFAAMPEEEEPKELFAAVPETEEPEELFAEMPEEEEPEELLAAMPEEEEPAEDTLAASGVDLSDPNRPLSAEDIAALFAQAGGAEEEPAAEPEEELPETEEQGTREVSAEEKPEDALASSGVDLSDPNRTLSADDIAALIASMGN